MAYSRMSSPRKRESRNFFLHPRETRILKQYNLGFCLRSRERLRHSAEMLLPSNRKRSFLGKRTTVQSIGTDLGEMLDFPTTA